MYIRIAKKIIKFILIYVLITGTFTYIGSLVLGVDLNHHSSDHKNLLQSLLLIIFELMGTLMSIYLFIKYIDKERPSNSNLFFQPVIYKDLVQGIWVSFAIMLSGFSLLLATHQIGNLHIDLNTEKILLSIGIFAVIAIMEEVLVRGFILRKLMKRLSKWLSLIISAVIFSLLHIFNSHVDILSIVNLFLAGTLLGLPYIFTRNLSTSIGLHFSWNLFQCLLGFNVSGSAFYALVVQGLSINNAWTGGLFGFEGSVLCLVFQIVAIVALYFTYSQRAAIKTREEQVSLAL